MTLSGKLSTLRPLTYGLVVAALGLLASIGLFQVQLAAARQTEQARFTQAADVLTKHLSQRLDVYTEIAIGLRNLFMVNPALDRRSFNLALAQLDLSRRYPGVKNVAFTRYITAANKAAFEAQVRADTSVEPLGYPGFKIHPAGERPEYFVADYLWPRQGNQGIHGLDISAQPANLASMHYSRDSGQTVVSGPFELLQESRQRTGFVLRVPVFRQPENQAQPPQAADFLGLVAITLRVYDLMAQIEDEGHLQGLQLTLADQGSSLPGLASGVQLPLYATPKPGAGSALRHQRKLDVYGRQWQLDFQPSQSFLSAAERRQPLLVGFSSGLIALLLGALVTLLAHARTAAQAQADYRGQALLESEQRWQFAIEGAGDGLWDWNLLTNKVFYSSQCKRLLGYNDADIGDHMNEWHQRLHPDDQPRALAAIKAHLTGAAALYLHEHRIRCKDGQWKWVANRGVILSRDADGRALRMIGTVQDITARKLSELALTDAHNLLMAVIETIPMRVFWKDQQLNYLGCNSLFAQDAGKTKPTDLIGHDDFQMGWAAQAALYRADDQRVMDNGVAQLFYDEPQTTPTGQTIWLRTSKVPLKDQTGLIVGVLGVYEDITQRKQAELQLRQLSQVAEQSSEAIVIADLTGRIEYVNAAFERTTGFERNEIIGKNPRLLHSGQTPPSTFADLWKTLLQGQTWSGELINRRNDGTVYIDWAVISPLRDNAGRVTHYVAVQEDITEKKRQATELDQHRHGLEQLVEQRTAELTSARLQADASNRAKSEFLANMSHEIRTPLNGVIGMADVLSQTGLTAEQRRMLGIITSSSLALLAILNDILDFSKIEAGKLDIEQIATPLREVVEASTQLMLNTALSKEVEISLFVDPALPEWIVCDPTRLRQILLNLLGNALKFVAQRSGHTLLHVYAGNHLDGSAHLYLSVIDNGIGMSPQVMSKLFQPFTQADSSTVRRFGGTGLGLSITQRLVHMLQGSISVQSAPHAGSEFIVELPLQPAAPPTGYQTRRRPDLHGISVLVINPDNACLTLLQTYLGSVDAQVIPMTDLAAARALLSTATTSTVLLLDQTQTTGADQPAGDELLAPAQDTRVVRLVRRRSSSRQMQGIEIPARPLLYHDLLQGVALACGRISLTEHAAHGSRLLPQPSSAPSVDIAAQTGQLILMAEDNETNRDVMQEQLRLLGYACEAANDGKQALAMWHNSLAANGGSSRYALLLTDCHMPNLDGFELTAAIRQSEPAGCHLPIIAITANAMQGEAERCLARGMDGYLSKPLRLHELAALLGKWLPLAMAMAMAPAHATQPSQTTGLATPAQPTSAPVWAADTLSSLVGDNPALHRRLLEKFLQHAQTQCTQIAAAQAAADLPTLALVAHTLKSAARSVGALALGELCQQLESAAQKSDTPSCTELLAALPEALAGAAQRINAHLALVHE